MTPGLAWWFANGERGLSSETLASYLGSGIKPNRVNYPHDPDDFRRCELLLRQVGHLRDRMTPSRMARLSPEWGRLAARWDDIHDLIEEEAPGYLKRCKWSAPRAYALMRACILGRDA